MCYLGGSGVSGRYMKSVGGRGFSTPVIGEWQGFSMSVTSGGGTFSTFVASGRQSYENVCLQHRLCYNSLKKEKSRIMQKRNVYIKLETFLRHSCLLISIMLTMMLCSCGYRGESTVAGMPASPDEGAAHIKGPDTAQNAEAGEVPEQGAGAGQNPEENAAQSSEAGVVPGSVSAQNPGISGNTQETSVESTGSGTADPDRNNWKFVLSFAGDINFDENWYTMQYYNTTANGIYDCISPELIQMMRDADIMCINNEFTYSTRGTPLKNKVYTFRAHPSRVNILKELGVDIVSLANNHVYDYGEESLTDTMATLREAGIEYVGAGHDLAEAMEPVYFEIQGRTIAYVAASRAEKYRMTPQATENSPGILRCYDTELFIRKIKKARENADYVIAYVHWGTEFTHELEEVQLVTGREYLDAGADIVIGAHPHCLQGIEFHNGKPIVYSLGNFWFNRQTVDTMLLNIHFHGSEDEESIELEIIPAIQANLKTSLVTEPSEKERIFSFLESISINAEINENGIITERKSEAGQQ